MNKKIKIIIAGAVVCVVLLGVGVYMILNSSSKAGASINNQLSKTTTNEAVKKKNTSNNDKKDTSNKNVQNSNTSNTNGNDNGNVKPEPMKTNPILNSQINENANTNTNAENMNYSDLFSQMFGYQNAYPQMVNDNQINFLKALTIYQLGQVKAMIPYTATTSENKTGISQYLEQLKQMQTDTSTILAVVSNLQTTSKNQNFINEANNFLTLNGTILSDLSNEISNMVSFNSSYAQLYSLPFGANMNTFVSELSSFNGSLGPDNSDANTWLKNAPNVFVMYTGPLSKSNKVSTSSTSTIKQN